MNHDPQHPVSAKKILKSIGLSLPMVLLTSLLTFGRGTPKDPFHLASMLLTFVFINALFFMMVFTGKTNRYRTIFFVAISLGFVATFIPNLLATRGNIAISKSEMIEGNVPFCHIVIPMTIIPAALTQTIIFPGHLLGGFAPIAGMIIIWLGASIAIGRGWCSWACFYGGLDEACSHIRKKPWIRKIHPRWTWLPYAVLLLVAVTAAATLSPTYCEWLCPFKAVTEFEAVTSFKTLIQTIIFAALFIGLVVVLPILTRRRTQCGLFCPMAGFQSFTNKANIFDVKIDRNLCADCGHCISTCPTFSLDKESVAAGKTRLSCAKCGHCVDACPKGAAYYHVKGTTPKIGSNLARMLFLYPAFLFGSVFATQFISDAIFKFMTLIKSFIA
jgi:ferredoxin-type protein NapH